MATVNLVAKFAPYVDEMLSTKSKSPMLTNRGLDWTGVHTVKIYRVNTSDVDDYDRPGTGPDTSRSGPVTGLDVITEGMPLKKGCSFTFAIDRLDTDETAQQLQAAIALARQQREVIIPEVNSCVYGIMSANAGIKPAAVALTAENIYTKVLKVSQTLDDAEAPEAERTLIVAPAVYVLMKKYKNITMEADIGNDLRLKGVLTTLDDANVVKVPAVQLPEVSDFLLAHPVATVVPIKLKDYRIHQDPPGISGVLVEGRIYYNAFVLGNKRETLYY